MGHLGPKHLSVSDHAGNVKPLMLRTADELGSCVVLALRLSRTLPFGQHITTDLSAIRVIQIWSWSVAASITMET